jgi:hypothetical protein
MIKSFVMLSEASAVETSAVALCVRSARTGHSAVGRVTHRQAAPIAPPHNRHIPNRKSPRQFCRQFPPFQAQSSIEQRCSPCVPSGGRKYPHPPPEIYSFPQKFAGNSTNNVRPIRSSADERLHTSHFLKMHDAALFPGFPHLFEIWVPGFRCRRRKSNCRCFDHAALRST